MSDIIGISSGAISAYQRALSTVSNNIANVNTEGYSRQEVVLQDSAPKQQANMYLGTGVMIQTIRRQFDEFAESNLRNSNSDLNAQGPMVDYTKRVMDIMGDKSIGLSSALDDYFNAAGSLSADPASTVLRTSFLRSADGVTSRFGELSGQLDSISTETRQGLSSVADKINTLTAQLALINQSMTRSPTLEGQPPELLDRRDLTLRQLSELVRTKLKFDANGTVSVSLGSTMTQSVVVDGQKALPIGVDPTGKNSSELMLDPYGKSEPLSELSGGKVGGYINFITQVLEPAQKNLNALAKTFVDETNQIQSNGIDAQGQIGQKLFAIDPAAPQAAAGIKLLITDGQRVATAAQFRVSEGNTNVTTTRASVAFDGHQTSTALSNTSLVNNPNPTAGVTFRVDGNREFVPVTSVAAGVTSTIYLDEMSPGQNLQVLTRDGRQLMGQTLTETEKYQMLQPANGFEPNATYSDAYLNQINPKAYRDIGYFYGAKAETLYKQNLDTNGVQGASIPLPASVETARISSTSFQIPANALTLNNVSMKGFTPISATQITLKGFSVNSPGSFDFNAVVDRNKVGVSVPVVAGDGPSEIASKLDALLQPKGLAAMVAPNGTDIIVSDNQARNISGVTFAPSTGSTGQPANVKVSSAASQISDWLNGSTTLDVDAPNFDSISFKLGGVSYQMSGLDPTHPAALAAALQADIRSKFADQDVSVSMVGTSIHIEDAQGRSLSDLSLNPAVAGANPGTTTISQSMASQTNVRAEVFSQLRIPVRQLQFDKPLTLNGQSITGFDSVNTLADAINNSGAGLTASLTSDGELLIENKQGTNIDVGLETAGNALNTDAGSYAGQIRMTKVYRDFKVSAATVDLGKPLAINGAVLNEVAYDAAPAALGDPPKNYVITSPFLSQPVSASSAQGLADALNGFQEFSTDFKATVQGDRLVIRPNSPGLNDQDLQKRFSVQDGSNVLTPQTSITNLDELVARISARQSETGVVASRDENGDLVLSTTDAAGRGEISIGPGKDSNGKFAPNMLGLEPLDYDLTARVKTKMLDPNFTQNPYNTDIRVSFGSYLDGNPPTTQYGDPSQLSKLGLRTAAYIKSASPDDLLVFVSGKGQAKVALGYAGTPANNRDLLRSQSLLVKFTAADRYSIIDASNGTELANRHFDPTNINPQISYEGLTLTLSASPQVGDSYKIDGNSDGLGNNVNILDMVSLSKKPLGDGKTIHDTYIDQINNIGNLSQQSQITQQALKVVNDQAVQSRDTVSGVNMDEEASALVKYQQAYQAAAKALQVAGQLFDSIVQIR
jgi:flagellar hook-associated protein FlgK